MSDPLALIGLSGPASCFLCGSVQCNHTHDSDAQIVEETPSMDRTYRITTAVIENGVQVYGVGAVIPLEEAVIRRLPGAIEQAGRKPMRSPEDRAVQPQENR